MREARDHAGSLKQSGLIGEVFQPGFATEADVMAEFAHRIKNDGRLRIHLEVRMPSTVHRSGTFRIDALLTYMTKRGAEVVVCVVEFKKPLKTCGDRGRQRAAYQSLKMPFFYCVGFNGIDDAIAGAYGVLASRRD